MQLDIGKHVGIPYTLLAADEIFEIKDTHPLDYWGTYSYG